MWLRYKNLSGNSGVQLYDYDNVAYSWIKITFIDDSVYEYTDDSCGWMTVMEMIELADRGIGLNRYINDNQPEYTDVTR